MNMDELQDYVLVSAHHCAPNMGSEHAVGWNLVSRLAKSYAILLITQDNEFRVDVELGVEQLKSEGCRIEAFFVQHGSRTDGRANNLRVGYYLTYRLYQWRVLALARSLMRRYRIAAVHQLTIVGFREPGYLWRLGLPFIWGPVGGLVSCPASLYQELPWRSRLFLTAREIATRAQFSFSRRVLMAYKATQRPGGAFIAATSDIGERFSSRFGGRYQWIPETGSRPIPSVRSRGAHLGPLRLLWVGALIDRKPMIPLLDAMAAIPNHGNRLELTVVGEGQSRGRYEAHARKLGIKAHFMGWTTHDHAQQHYQRADIFVMLSLLDLTTNVVLEAMGAGLPILCLDHHGYAGIVTPACGIKLPVSDPSSLRQAITETLQELVENPAPLSCMGHAAWERAAEYTWDRNAETLGALYPRSAMIDQGSAP